MSDQAKPPGDGSPPDQPPEGGAVPRKRRVRYKGTHPRRFSEKYKETSDATTMEKIIAKGGTPAGTHRPIMVAEILEWLNPQPGKIYVDCTLGYGGHTSEILKRIQPNGKLVSFDRDPIESAKTEKRVREQVNPADGTWIVVHDNYSALASRLKDLGLTHVDGVLADLGLSSMQIDDPARGFTFKHEGPLDLRMNPHEGEPASRLLAQLSQDELQAILEENSDEPRAKWCAKAILDRQKKKPIETTTEFADAIKAWIKTLSPKTREQEGDTPIRRAMQALRIEVNQEFASLDRLLEQIPQVLTKNGRAAILSFHSGEDRRVKKSFQANERAGVFRQVSPEAQRPSFEEQRSNSRSKSAKLRLAER